MNSVEKRRATILKKREKKEQAKLKYAVKLVEKHKVHLTQVQGVKNINAYATVLQQLNQF